ncbi:MAG: hypothetical protein LBH20_09350 [Treponema sp.]|jgi:hypothetical protein|nr:hypothetical protein [Treponema sp.]
MVKSNIKYRVTLTAEEREAVQKLVKKGNTAGCRIRHAQILPAPDGIPVNEHWAAAVIGGAYGSRQQAAGVLRKRFVEGGRQAAVERKKRGTPQKIKIDGEAEITALACSQPPEGRARRALQLPTDKVAELGYRTASQIMEPDAC